MFLAVGLGHRLIPLRLLCHELVCQGYVVLPRVLLVLPVRLVDDGSLVIHVLLYALLTRYSTAERVFTQHVETKDGLCRIAHQLVHIVADRVDPFDYDRLARRRIDLSFHLEYNWLLLVLLKGKHVDRLWPRHKQGTLVTPLATVVRRGEDRDAGGVAPCVLHVELVAVHLNFVRSDHRRAARLSKETDQRGPTEHAGCAALLVLNEVVPLGLFVW